MEKNISNIEKSKTAENPDIEDKKAVDNKNDTEFSTDITADDLINKRVPWHLKMDNRMHYANEVQALPQYIKALIVISWICAAMAGFVSVYFAILGIVAAYTANRIAPGAGRAALITNIILAIINLLLSYMFFQTVRNIFALL